MEPQVAVVLHVYYPELWPDFLSCLRQLPANTDLYVTTTHDRGEQVRDLVTSAFSRAHVFEFPNRGRDVGPLVELLRMVPLSDYDYVLKLHTKSSRHLVGVDSGGLWRRYLLETLLPVGQVDQILKAFDHYPDVGIFASEDLLVDVKRYSGNSANIEGLKRIGHRLEVEFDELNYSFPAGTMFWARGKVYAELAKLEIRQEDFDEECGQVDGTFAHVLERAFPMLSMHAGCNLAPESIQHLKELSGEDSINEYINGWMQDGRVPETLAVMLAEKIKTAPEASAIHILMHDPDQDIAGLELCLDSLRLDRTAGLKLSVTVLSDDAYSGRILDSVDQYIHLEGKPVPAALDQWLAERNPADWLLFVAPGERFVPFALSTLMLDLQGVEGCRAVFCDEFMDLGAQGTGVTLRPDMNLDFLLSYPAVMSSHWLFNIGSLRETGSFNDHDPEALELDLIFRLLELGGLSGIGHQPVPLLRGRARVAGRDSERTAILRHLRTRGYPNAQVFPGISGTWRVHYGHESQPLVSIIIPTKDQLALLQTCVESILEKTHYRNFEILIVDNNSETSEARAWLDGVESLRVDNIRVLRYPKPFNFSAINNYAVREARGEYIVLLNNDTGIIKADWLDAMLNHAQRSEVGAVGAKLLFPDGKVQHAGVVLGLRGPAEHGFIGSGANDAGYMNRLQVDQDYSVVTAACMMIRKTVYEQVGGLDEDAFQVSYNDVDFCLRVGQAGYLVVWTPHALVMHVANASQVSVDKTSSEDKKRRFKKEQRLMYERWLPQLASDPAYNRNLSLSGPGFEVEMRVELSWQPHRLLGLPSVLAYAADPWGCGHYRVIQPLSAMKRDAVAGGMMASHWLSLPEFKRLDPDAIVVQRQVSPEAIEVISQYRTIADKPLVFELDDYLPNLPLKSIYRQNMPKDVLKSLRKALKLVDRFVVSTEPLAEAMSGLHTDIVVVENRLPTEWWKDVSGRRRMGRKPRVGWAGGIGHTGDLELISDVVKDLKDEVEWVFFGMCPNHLKPYVAEVHEGVDIEKYSRKLASMNLDLAVAPLEDNLFNRCKSNLRLLEYGACGFPVVCSDVQPYLQHKLPVTTVRNRYKDWVDAIRAHVSDLDAAARLGDELRTVVRRDWMLQGESLLEWQAAWSRF